MMKMINILSLPFDRGGGWEQLRQTDISMPILGLLVILPMSLLAPVLLYYAGTHYGNEYLTGFADKDWRTITIMVFLAELVTFLLLGWMIHAVTDSHGVTMSHNSAYLLATVALLPLWSSSLALLVPQLWVSLVAIPGALVISCLLVYHGIQAMCQRSDHDVVAMSATYLVMAASLLLWGVLIGGAWEF